MKVSIARAIHTLFTFNFHERRKLSIRKSFVARMKEKFVLLFYYLNFMPVLPS
jgi:hypothetical protein